MNTSQAATYLQLHEKTVLRLLRRGLLVGHQPNGVNGCWRVHRADADAYVRGTSSKARRAS
jgi:excisionase family DNA binding protein